MPKPRGVLIAGNWKMNHTAAETEAFFAAVAKAEPLGADAKAALKKGSLGALVFPPALSLAAALERSDGAPFRVEVGAQNVHWERQGAFTGEVSGPMVAELGARWALVGHSERRQYFGETDETARKRCESLLAQGFQVILCIGETRAEREAGQARAVLARQLQGVFPAAGKGAAAYLDGRLIVAYEPVWAIGTGLTATPAQAQEAHVWVREELGARAGSEAAQDTPILYGGSVTPENADQLLGQPDIDGALVGGASLKPLGFLQLLAAGGRALKG